MNCNSTPIARILSLFLILCLTPLAASEYIVKPGDTLTGIARQHLSPDLQYNSPQITQFINQVMQQNSLQFPNSNPHLLSIGMKLNLPGSFPSPEPELEPVAEPQPVIVAVPEIKVPEKVMAQISQLKGSGWLMHSDETQHALVVGQTVKQGDSIRTEPNSQVMVKFADQASLTVKESSQVNIEEYHWDEQSSSGRSIIDFLRGAFRAVSGLIGKNEPKNYAVKTPVATLGVRGTDFGARYCASSSCEIKTEGNTVTLSQGLYIGVLDGQISSQSDGKETLVDAGEAAYQKDAESPVKPVKNLPGLIFSEAEIKTYEPIPSKEIESSKIKKIPFYQAFWLNSLGNVIKDSQGHCIRSIDYLADHNVVECQ
mgnify:CR=1 FL=1